MNTSIIKKYALFSISLLLLPAVSKSQTLIADYQFSGTDILSSVIAGAPDLINPGTSASGNGGNGGAGTSDSYTINGNTLGALEMPAASGLSMNISGLLANGANSNYSVAILFKDNGSTTSSATGFQALFDPTGGYSDNHVYIDSGKLDAYSGGANYGGTITSGSWTQVIVSVATVSGNNVVQMENTQVGGTGVYSSYSFTANVNSGYWIPGSQINFFRDDGADAFNAASVARIQVYNGALSQSQMSSLDLTSEAAAAVPEPQTWAAALCGIGMLVGFRRLRRIRPNA